jgi:hypothetical protein
VRTSLQAMEKRRPAGALQKISFFVAKIKTLLLKGAQIFADKRRKTFLA